MMIYLLSITRQHWQGADQIIITFHHKINHLSPFSFQQEHMDKEIPEYQVIVILTSICKVQIVHISSKMMRLKLMRKKWSKELKIFGLQLSNKIRIFKWIIKKKLRELLSKMLKKNLNNWQKSKLCTKKLIHLTLKN